MADLSSYDIGIFHVSTLTDIANPYTGKTFAFVEDTNSLYRCTGMLPAVWEEIAGDSITPPSAGRYVIAGAIPGVPTDGARIVHPPLYDIVIAAGGGLSRCIALVAATATATFTLQKNGVTFGTMSFAAGAYVATFSIAAQTTILTSDYLTVIAPSPPDATLADIGYGLGGVG